MFRHLTGRDDEKASRYAQRLSGSGCSIKGEIVFADLLRVHGHASGTVSSQGELLVGEGGVVEGEISVGRLVVAGAVRGTVREVSVWWSTAPERCRRDHLLFSSWTRAGWSRAT